MNTNLSPAIFLDRDGTIIEDRGHLRSPSEVGFYPDTVRALGKLQKHFLLFVVTHQPGIASGIVSADEVSRVNEYVVAELRRNGVVLSGVYCCPHRREEQCACIKPRPFFLEIAAFDHAVDLVRSFVVGDHPHDVALADNAGATGIYVLSGHGAKHRKELPPRTPVVPGIREAAEWILASREMQRQEDGDPGILERAAGILRNGDIVAFPKITQDIDAMICWFSDKRKLNAGDKLLLMHTTRDVTVIVKHIQYKVNVNTLHKIEDDKQISLNEIARIHLRVSGPLFVDDYSKNRITGSLILVDPFTHETLAGGMIRATA